ncbi:DMT family transporter [Baekduia soli]|uniref:DMT family transporter n=1 Tax=Baekduia soli TaxID=496014 RepID=A0A5B8U6Y1_9ACTN|nr:DMT family transporter [Baekduia soli]QEC48422.1 DMT family transporter [Baekduia soli]
MTRGPRPAPATNVVPYLLLAATVVLWGSAFRATAVGTQHASPVVFSTLRALPAAALLLAITALRHGTLPRGRTLAWAALSGLFMVTLAFEGIAEGTSMAGAGNAAILLNTTPFFVLVLARFTLGERIAPWGVVGLVTAFIGIVTMVSSQLSGGTDTGRMVLGMAIALMAGAGFAVGTLLVKATVQRYPGTDIVAFTAVQHLVGGVALVPLALLYGHVGDTSWGAGSLWTSVAWVAAGSSAFAAVAYTTALRSIPATRASAWQFLAPVVAVVVEVARGNAPEAVVLAGMAIVILGVAVVSRAPAPPPAAAEPAVP